MKLTKFFAFALGALAFVGCGTEGGNVTPTGNIFLTVEPSTLKIGETATFIVTDSEGLDVTSAATIYFGDMETVVNGNKFTAENGGLYTFIAMAGAEFSNQATVTVMAQMPAIPEDTDPAKTKFNHRAVVIDQTGVNCGYCPQATNELKKLEGTEWHQYYNEVTCHAGSYAGGDPGNSAAADALNSFQKGLISGYPCILVNFYGKPNDYGFSSIVNYLKTYVQKDGVDVGVALSVEGDPTNVYCAAQIKSGVEREYKVNAWLLESKIYSPNQAGASSDLHRYYNYALRNMSAMVSNSYVVQGESTGIINAGGTYDYCVEIPVLSTKWNCSNMGVLVVVSAANESGKFEVVNSRYCPVGESKSYEYAN